MNRSRVLVVDDQDNWRQVIRDVLTDVGYQMADVASASEAKDLLNTELFDIVVLDVRLADDDLYDVQGVELLDWMKNHLGERLPVIIMTGYSFAGLENTVRTKYGVQHFVKKGTHDIQDIHAFRDLVASVLNERKKDRPSPEDQQT